MRENNLVTCDSCGEEILTNSESDLELPDGWMWTGINPNKLSTGHECPSCRYAGALAHLKETGIIREIRVKMVDDGITNEVTILSLTTEKDKEELDNFLSRLEFLLSSASDNWSLTLS